MMTIPACEKPSAMPRHNYGRRHDISYRVGLVLQVLGAGLLAVLFPLESPFYSAGIMLFETGVLLSGIYVPIERSWVRKIVLGSVVLGFVLQIIGFNATAQHAGTIIIAGIGFVCAAAAGMMSKEAYGLGYREGGLLMMFAFPVLVLINLMNKESFQFNTIGFAILFLLLLFTTGKKLRQPLIFSCSTTIYGTLEKKL